MNTEIAKRLLGAAVCVSGLFNTLPAFAQRAGTYSGFQANGQPFSLVVSRDQGQLVVESINVQVQTTCRDRQTLLEDTGYGQVGPIVNGSGQDSLNFGATYFSESFTFDDATHSVSGFVTVDFSIFRPTAKASTVPAYTTFCSTGNQAFAAVLGQNVSFDPKAKVIRFHKPKR